MASFNSSVFLSLLVVISAFMAAPSSVEAQILVPSFISTNGTLACAVNFSSLNGTSTPFSNAMVELRCGNTSLANTTTNAVGTFNFALRPIESLLTNILPLLLGPSNSCKVIVNTPLANCNATLPSTGKLVAVVTQVVIDSVPGVITNVMTLLSNFQLNLSI